MKRIIILGSPGSGKSTLARELAGILHLPLFHLDQIWHLSDGSHISRDDFDQKLQAVMASPAWIIDGNYSRTIEKRLNCCDTAILLDYPADLCLQQAKSRIGHSREDLPWIETKLDPEFEELIRHFPDRKLPEICRMLERFSRSVSIYILHSHQESEEFLYTLRRLEKITFSSQNHPAS